VTIHEVLDFLGSAVSFVNKNSGAILAITTLVYAIITGRMLSETKRMRESQTEPYIFINVQPMERARFILNMVIQNIGPGPAYDLRFKVEPDILLGTGNNLSEINLMKQGFKYLAPNQKLECIVAHSITEAKKKEKTLHYVTVYYKNKNKKTREHTYILDFTEYFGMVYSEADPYKGVIEKLETIHRDIDGVTKDSGSKLRVIAYTKEEYEEGIRRELEKYEEEIEKRKPKEE
jgi:hypothetical protein